MKLTKPDAVVDFLDTDGLTGQTSTKIDLFAIQTQPAAVSDDDRLVVEGVAEFLNAPVRAAGRRVNLGGTFHVQSFVRTFAVELLNEGIELGLLLKQVGAGGTSGFCLQGQMHAFVTAVLLRMAGFDAFDRVA